MKLEMTCDVSGMTGEDVANVLDRVADAALAMRDGVTLNGTIRSGEGVAIGKWRIAEPRTYTKKETGK